MPRLTNITADYRLDNNNEHVFCQVTFVDRYNILNLTPDHNTKRQDESHDILEYMYTVIIMSKI